MSTRWRAMMCSIGQTFTRCRLPRVRVPSAPYGHGIAVLHLVSEEMYTLILPTLRATIAKDVWGSFSQAFS